MASGRSSPTLPPDPATATIIQTPIPRRRRFLPAAKDEPQVALDDLSKPTAIESRLREALRRHDDGVRVTVPNGTARMGDFSIGSNETVPGHLLVVQGTADIYGKLLGNLVTVDGDVVIHPGRRRLGRHSDARRRSARRGG